MPDKRHTAQNFNKSLYQSGFQIQYLPKRSIQPTKKTMNEKSIYNSL